MRSDLRLALPSKGRLEAETLEFLAAAGLRVHKPNPRQYFARIPAIPNLTVVFQRPGDIVVSVRDGSVDFGLTGLDSLEEGRGDDDSIFMLHDSLKYGWCDLKLAVPEDWPVFTLDELKAHTARLGHPLRVATKFHTLTTRFLRARHVHPFALIDAEGTLEVAPAIGYADIIADLVSSGQTLRDNRLRALDDGLILQSQAVLFANRHALRANPTAFAVARQLLEYIEAHLRGQENCLVVANVRRDNPDDIAQALFAHPDITGLQGPTIAPVYARAGARWHSVSIVVRKDRLIPAIRALRDIGGSGVIVSPVTYIFEEEPDRAKRLNDLRA